MLRRLNEDLVQANYFANNNTDLVLLDAEIVPWNLKARELISSQYAHVAEAALLDREYLLEKLREAEKIRARCYLVDNGNGGEAPECGCRRIEMSCE